MVTKLGTHHRIASTLVAALALCAGACGSNNPPARPPALDATAPDDGGDGGMDAPVVRADGSGADGGDATAGALSDAQVADVLAAADMGEISLGTYAQARATNAAVGAFARMMVSDHTMSSQNLMTLASRQGITPAPSALSTMLRSDAATMATGLASLTGAALDRAYMDGQVATHQRVLSIIDSALLPNATNAELRAALTSTVRPMVALHLQMATSVRAGLGAM